MITLEEPSPEAFEDMFSRWHGAKALMESRWPWTQYLGVTAKKRPYIRGRVLCEPVDLGRLGIAWTDGPKSVWVWEP